MSDDWARRMAEKIRKAAEAKEKAEQLELNRRGQISSEAPHLWDSIQTEIRTRTRILNSNLGTLYLQVPATNNNQQMRIDAPSINASLILMFDIERPAVTYKLMQQESPDATPSESKGTLTFKVNEGRVWLVNTAGENLSTSAVAEEFLEMLVVG